MTQNNDDPAVETLTAIRSEISPNLDEQLILSCYAIQKKHQFNPDRLQSVQAMDRLIENYVDAIMADESGTDKSA